MSNETLTTATTWHDRSADDVKANNVTVAGLSEEQAGRKAEQAMRSNYCCKRRR